MSPRMLGPWLAANLETKAETLTLEMLKQKAASGQTNAVIAAEFGMSENAFDQRIHRFTTKWIPRWKKHKPTRRCSSCSSSCSSAASHGGSSAPRSTRTRGTTAVPVLSAAPTASVIPPEHFNNADPTQEQQEKKPQRSKP